MRTMTIDLCRLQQALDSPGALEHYLNLHSGEIVSLDPEQPQTEVLEVLEDEPDRFAHIEPLDNGDRIAMREDFLFHLRDPHAHPLLAAALGGRRPLRAFSYELEQFPQARADWQAYEKTHLKEMALSWLQEQGIEPSADARTVTATEDIPAGILRRLRHAGG